MKHVISVFALLAAGVIFSNCNSEDDPKPDDDAAVFETLDRGAIMALEAELSNGNVTVTDEDGAILSEESGNNIVVYKTSAGRFGKMKIESIDLPTEANNRYTLHIAAVTYNEDGTVFKESSNLTVRSLFTCDLDQMIETSDINVEYDFRFGRATETECYFQLANSARLKVLGE